MTQEAIITNIRDDGLAEVVVERLSVCQGNCNECDKCEYDKLIKTVVQNPINASRGQHVMIETPTKGVVRGALAIYILPLIGLFAGYFVGALLSLAEGGCILAAFIGAAAGVAVAAVLSRKRYKADPTPSKIVSVIEPEDDEE